MYDADICLRYCQICWVFLGIPRNLAGSAHALTLDLQYTMQNLSPRSTSLMICVPLYRIWINPTFINGVYYSDSPLSSFAWKAGIPNNKILAPPLIEGVKMASGFWAEDAELV